MEIIRDNLTDEKLKTIYNFNDFKNVLNTGFNTDKFQNISHMDFDEIVSTINALSNAY